MIKIGNNYIADDGAIITQADIDALPNIPLCDECKAFGYCRKGEKRVQLVVEMPDLMDTTEVERMIPWGVLAYSLSYLGNYTKKHMKIALEAFHQQDYETAILHSKTVLEEDRYRPDALLCVAASEYFLDNFEVAKEYASQVLFQERIPTSRHNIERFIETCDILSGGSQDEESTILKKEHVYDEDF